MKKRILSAILVLAMVLSMAPAVVTAAPVETAQSPKAGTHAATGHTCESEGCGTTTWQPWPTNGTIPTSGHYYLTQNVQLTGQLGLSNKNLHICLNGYVMTAKANTRLGWLYGTSKLVITDCTAYEEDGVYYAGAMTGGVDKVTSTGGGGAFYVYANATLELHDGKLTNCSSITGGGAFYNNGIVKLYGGELSGNVAASGTAAKHGGAIFNNAGGVLTAENVRFHDNHADNGEGGAFQNWGNATFKNCTFTGNNAATGGAMNLGGTNKTVLIDGCTFTGNTAGVVSAINNKIGTGSITIKDTVVTGNSNTTGFGAVNVLGSAKAVILQGKVIITDNTTGEDTPNNLHVQDGTAEGVDASGLADGSSIGVHLRGTRKTFSTANTANNKCYFTGDTDGLVVVLDEDNRLALTNYIPPEHAHCVCGKAGCTEHEQLEYQKLTDGEQLKAGGAFYLDGDLTLEKLVGIQNGTKLSICLNGHTIYSNATSGPLFWTYNEAQLDICDCDVVPGAISGHNNESSTAGTFFIRDKGELNFYGGQILQCADKKGGGAIRVELGATLNFYDGVISGCSSEGGGGAIFNSGTANIYGGQFVGNSTKLNEEAKDGGAIFNNTTGELHVENAVFQDNCTEFGSGGAIRSWGNATVRNCTFTGNNARTAGAIAPAGADKTFLLEGCTITRNTASVASAINVAAGVAVTIKDTEITGNSNKNGFGAVNVIGAANPVVLQGKVIITGNTTGETASSNLHVQAGATDGFDVSALTEEAAIGVSLQKTRINNEQLHFTTASELNNKDFFTSDDPNYLVVLGSDNQLHLRYNYTHIHCVCGKTDCTEETHEKIYCKPWSDPTSLPVKGCYYLETDVTISFRAGLDNSTLYLCLNGHTILGAEAYEKSRAFYLRNAAQLTLTDCQAQPGKIQGFRAAAIVCDSNCIDACINLYCIEISDNHSAKTGGAIIVQNGVVFNMYSGKITGNSVASSLKEDNTYEYCYAGGVYVGSGAIFNLYGGEISGNKAKAIDKKGGLGSGPIKQYNNVFGKAA